MAPTGGGQNVSSVPRETAGQVAASNSTLNAFLGGRRQPSWMANAKPVQPSPRPPQPPVRQPSQLQQPTQTSTPPVSTAALQQQQAQKRHFSNPSINAHQLRWLPSQPYQQLQPAQTGIGNWVIPEAVLPSPAPSDEPSPSISNSHESPSTANSALPTSPTETPYTDTRYFVLDAQLGDPQPTDQRQADPSVGDSTTATAQPSSYQNNEVSGASPSPSAAAMVLNTPPAPNLPVLRPAQQSHPQVPAAKRRRIENSPFDLLNHLRASEVLQNHMLACRAAGGYENSIQHARHVLLQEACNQSDLFFVVLHQIFCTWSVAPNDIRTICNNARCDISIIEIALGTMGAILRNNSTLPPQHLAWLANFPAKLADLRTNVIYADTLSKVLNFLVRISFHWMVISQEHKVAGYPLLIDELLSRFQLFSPVMQVTVFRVSCKNLGIRDNYVGQTMEQLFREDQRRYLSGAQNSSKDPLYRDALITRYRELVQEARSRDAQAYQQNSSSHPSPVSQHSHLQNSPQIQNVSFPRNSTTGASMPPIVTTGHLASPAIMSPMLSHSPVGNHPGGPSAPTHVGQSPTQSSPTQASANMAQLNSYMMPLLSPNAVQQQPQFNIAPPNRQPTPHQVQVQQQQPYLQQQQYFQAPMAPNEQMQRAQPAYQYPSQVQQALNNQQSWQAQQSGRRSSQNNVVSYPHPSSRPSPNISQAHVVNPQRANNVPSGPPAPGRNMYQTQQGAVGTPYIRPSSIRPESPAFRSQQFAVPGSARLIPPPGMRINMQEYPHDPYQKSCLLNTLHQAHCRSPKRVINKELPSSSVERHYQAVKSFLLEPTPVLPHRHLHKFAFAVEPRIWARVCKNETFSIQSLPVSRFTNGSFLVRIRCCYLRKPTAPVPDTDWVTTDAVWPEHIFIEVNNKSMAIRRKAHYSKDLPIDISEFVVSGENSLKVSVPQVNNVPPNRYPFIAIELLEVLGHSAVMHMVREKGYVSPEETRNIIKRRLAGPTSDGKDDDLAMVDSDLSIDLADPFTFSIFTVPVRGKACTHLECFDLETWLNTRLGKKTMCICGNGVDCKRCKEPSLPDKWRCPLCDGDARPYSLRVDGFLAEIREQLRKENKLRTKSILVSSDGSWRPKEQADDTDVDSDDDGTAVPAASRRSSARATEPPREVIELDDD